MLLELIVENYAVVEQARIRFGDGLNVLSGETGSGKSIVVDSLGLLLGARASAEMIRSGASRARVCQQSSRHHSISTPACCRARRYTWSERSTVLVHSRSPARSARFLRAHSRVAG